MAKQTYALDPGGPKRLEISWGAFWKNITIRLDGNVIGTIPGQKELAAGQEFHLPDGSVVKVQLAQKFTVTELQVLRNGTPLPGSASDPGSVLRTAYGIVFFIAGINISLGVVALLFQVGLLTQMGLGLSSIIFGFVFLVLGFFVRRRSLAALVIAIVVFALDGFIGIGWAILEGYSPGIGGILVRVVLLIPMIQGVGAVQSLKQAANP